MAIRTRRGANSDWLAGRANGDADNVGGWRGGVRLLEKRLSIPRGRTSVCVCKCQRVRLIGVRHTLREKEGEGERNETVTCSAQLGRQCDASIYSGAIVDHSD